jgi:leucyl aminopeptidase
MPGGDAYRPDDILVAMNGKSVHIDNTDAEGRLILADALSYVHKYDPKEVIDFATLTGACVVALGNERSGLFSPQDKLADSLTKSSREEGENLWRLPVGEEYSKAMKSEIADITNTGTVGGRGCGGASTAAAFLQFFTKNYQDENKKAYTWAHIDLSSSHIDGKGNGYMRGGANGFGVITMINYLSK